MVKNELKSIDGKKIRRQYFNAPLIFLFSLMLAIPYFITVISLAMEKYGQYELPTTFATSALICIAFSLPFLILRVLNKHFFGRIICVLNEEGIYHPKGMLKWEAMEKIEYAIDSKPRYKSDSAKAFRAIVYYASGTKHLILEKAPLSLVSQIKKRRKNIDIQIKGVVSLFPAILVITASIAICPHYIALLINAPGASNVQITVFAAIWIILGIIRIPVFDAFSIEYRFWSKILPKKWLFYIVRACYYPLFFVAFLVLVYFPNWFTVAALGICVGIVQPPLFSRYERVRSRKILSYEQLFDIYIKGANFWENKIKQRKNKSGK